MPSPLTEDQINDIIDDYAKTGSVLETVENVDHAEGTVRKYAEQALDEGDERLSHLDEFTEAEEVTDWEGVGPGESPFRDQSEAQRANDYAGMSTGDFIKDFFEDFEVGIKTKWVTLQARRADRRNMLPNKQSLQVDLLNMSSGISQSSNIEAEYIAEEYWAAAERYISRTGGQADTIPMSHNAPGRENPQQAFGSGAAGIGQGFVPPSGHSSMQGPQNPQMQMFQMMLQRLERMEAEIRDRQPPNPSQSNDQSTLNRLHELKQEQEILEELSGGDERLEQIEEQILGIQRSILEEDQQSQPTPQVRGESFEDRLLALASQDPNVSLSEVLDVIDERDSTVNDPTILEKRFEKDIREMELEHESDRTEKIGSILETAASRFGEGFASRLAGGETDETSQTDPQVVESEPHENGQQGQTPHRSEVDMQSISGQDIAAGGQAGIDQEQTCPHCDSDMRQGPNQIFCTECEYGIGPCDLCGFPVEIPPIGEAKYGRCGSCEEILETPDDPQASVVCETCDWEGVGMDLRGELLECGNCGEFRPIMRKEAVDAQQEQLEDLMEG